MRYSVVPYYAVDYIGVICSAVIGSAIVKKKKNLKLQFIKQALSILCSAAREDTTDLDKTFRRKEYTVPQCT